MAGPQNEYRTLRTNNILLISVAGFSIAVGKKEENKERSKRRNYRKSYGYVKKKVLSSTNVSSYLGQLCQRSIREFVVV